MPRPDPDTILTDARRLRDQRFARFFARLQERADQRFNAVPVDVPDAYQKTVIEHRSNIIEDEGRQIATLIHAMPTPHLPPPTPEDQPATTAVEMFLAAMHQELEACYGPVWRQCTLAQVHDNIGWVYFAPKRKPYADQPAPPDTSDLDELARFSERTTRYKQDAGIKAVWDYQFCPTATIMYEGPVYNPYCVYVWKEVRESELRALYGVWREKDGTLHRIEPGSPPGYPADTAKNESLVTIIEYWDAEWCVIIADEHRARFMRGADHRGYLLAEWRHRFGRVPFFARPAYVTEQIDEDRKFSGQLDGIHTEIPTHKRLRTMMDAVAYQTAFAPLQIVTREAGEQIVDDEGNPMTVMELVPGKAFQLGPGQEIRAVPQSPEISVLAMEVQASEMRMQRYSLPPVVKGISPGADTANAAISNLRAFNLSNLKPMADEAARQAQAMYRFALERIREMEETIYVFDAATNSYLSLNAEAIPSINVQVRVTPDQGQMQFLMEKHYVDLWQAGAITESEMHAMRGKENPEEYVLANAAERLRKQLEPVIMQQVIADLGMLDAVNAMIQANGETGSARNAVPGLMQRVEELNSGMGRGSPGQPRQPGVRMPALDVNTQQAQANGAAGVY